MRLPRLSSRARPIPIETAANTSANTVTATSSSTIEYPSWRRCDTLGSPITSVPMRGPIVGSGPYLRTASPSQRVNEVVPDSKLAHSELMSVAR